MNELRQEAFRPTFGGQIMHGSARVAEVENCGVLDDSERWGNDCVKVILGTGSERVALYFSSARRDEVAALNSGQRYTFDNCTTISIKNWGFWSTATCDMP